MVQRVAGHTEACRVASTGEEPRGRLQGNGEDEGNQVTSTREFKYSILRQRGLPSTETAVASFLGPGDSGAEFDRTKRITRIKPVAAQRISSLLGSEAEASDIISKTCSRELEDHSARYTRRTPSTMIVKLSSQSLIEESLECKPAAASGTCGAPAFNTLSIAATSSSASTRITRTFFSIAAPACVDAMVVRAEVRLRKPQFRTSTRESDARSRNPRNILMTTLSMSTALVEAAGFRNKSTFSSPFKSTVKLGLSNTEELQND
eukprot:284816184_6